MRKRYHIGVDLGQRQDHSAIAILKQYIVTSKHRDPLTYQPFTTRHRILVHLEPLALTTAYRHVSKRLEEITEALSHTADHLTTTVEATGLGGVVTEDLQTLHLPGNLFPVVFTSGEHQRYDRGKLNVSKKDLMQNLVRDLESTSICFPPTSPSWTS